jgi:hypothetical protein
VAFRDFLDESLCAIEREAPAAYAQLCRHLAPREVLLRVDEEEITVRFGRGRAALDVPQHPAVRVAVTTPAILDVIDARYSLLDAVLEGAMVLQGRLDDLLAFHDGLLAYVHGAVRAPSLPDLLTRFRAAAAGGEEP